jgi:hypothetical protein
MNNAPGTSNVMKLAFAVAVAVGVAVAVAVGVEVPVGVGTGVSVGVGASVEVAVALTMITAELFPLPQPLATRTKAIVKQVINVFEMNARLRLDCSRPPQQRSENSRRVIYLTRSMARSPGRYNIGVNAIAPAVTR